MTHEQALGIVVAKTKVERYRWLCSDENRLSAPNDRETWRRWIIDEAEGLNEFPDITAHLAEASAGQMQPKPCCGGVPLPT